MPFESFLTFLLNNQKNHEIRAESYPIAYKAKQKSKLEPITYKVKEKQHSKFKELISNDLFGFKKCCISNYNFKTHL